MAQPQLDLNQACSGLLRLPYNQNHSSSGWPFSHQSFSVPEPGSVLIPVPQHPTLSTQISAALHECGSIYMLEMYFWICYRNMHHDALSSAWSGWVSWLACIRLWDSWALYFLCLYHGLLFPVLNSTQFNYHSIVHIQIATHTQFTITLHLHTEILILNRIN